MIVLEPLSLPCPVNRMYSPQGKAIRKSKEARAGEKRMIAEIYDLLGGRPESLTGDIQVDIIWNPARKNYADVDAYIKSTLDGLEAAGVYVNDSQVVDVHAGRMPLITGPHPDKGTMTVSVWEVTE